MAGPSRSTPSTSTARHEEYTQPPRPSNAWILYRADKSGEFRDGRMTQAQASRLIAQMWKSESEEVRRAYEHKAEEAKYNHAKMYPDYRFCPRKKEDKLKSKEANKQRRRVNTKKKGKARDATPPDAQDATVTPPAPSPSAKTATLPMPSQPPATATPSMPFLPSTSAAAMNPFTPDVSQSRMFPEVLVFQNPYMFYTPEPYYGPGGPSPPMSAAPSPSPAPLETPQSPSSDGTVPSSSSSPSAEPSVASTSQTSISPSQLFTNQSYLPSLPDSQHPSTDMYATDSPPAAVQSPPLTELSSISPQAQSPSPNDAVVPATNVWDNNHPQLSIDVPQSSELANYSLPVEEPQTLLDFSGHFLTDQTHSATDMNGTFDFSVIESSDMVVQHTTSDQTFINTDGVPTADFSMLSLGLNGWDDDFRQGIAALTGNDMGAVAPEPTLPLPQDIDALFHLSKNPDVAAYMAARQRQPSALTQDIMSFLNLDQTESSTDNDSPAASTLPVPTTVAPEQMHLQNTQHIPPQPILIQTTNTPPVASGSSYVPPSGAIYSSTRRVGGTWKPSYTASPQEADSYHFTN